MRNDSVKNSGEAWEYNSCNVIPACGTRSICHTLMRPILLLLLCLRRQVQDVQEVSQETERKEYSPEGIYHLTTDDSVFEGEKVRK